MLGRFRWQWIPHAVAALSLVVLAGCGSSTSLGEVEGTLLIDGQPADKIRVRFEPEPGTEGPASMGDTDAEGRFTLRTLERGGASREGAAVGTHRVLLTDIRLAESATGRDVPQRVDPAYMNASSTPLQQEVQPGPQSITIEID